MMLKRKIRKIKRAKKTVHLAKEGRKYYTIVNGSRKLYLGAKKLLTPKYH